MAQLTPTVDPSEVGIDPTRLARIDDVLRPYVDEGLLPFVDFLLTRRGEVVHRVLYGNADVEAGRAIEADAIHRIFSMTKPVTSVALMMLHEQGKVLLEDPVEKYLPALANPQVWVEGETEADVVTRPADRSINIVDLLTHTSGLTYGFQQAHPVDALYRERGLGEFGVVPTFDNAELVKMLGDLPLQFSPGTNWWYSMAHEVVGALVETISGQTLDEYFQEHIFAPLGMVDTDFHVDEQRAHRFSNGYAFVPGGIMLADHAATSLGLEPPILLSGGGGLCSTTSDYHRFTQFLLRRGELDGVRLLSARSVDFMTANHLPGARTLDDFGTHGFSEAAMEGMGFGFGVIVNCSPQANRAMGSVGDYGWGGAASTVFNIDPAEELTMSFMTQLFPSNTYPIRRQLRAAVYQALVD